MSQWVPNDWSDDDNGEYQDFGGKLHDADVIVTIHSPILIPSILESEYKSLEASVLYTTHFTKQIIQLMPSPYSTHCQEYSTTSSKLIC